VTGAERREDVRSWTTSAVTIVTLAFLLLPQVILLVESFTASNYLAFPPARYGLRWYAFILSDTEWLDALSRTLVVAAIVTPATLLIALAAAYALDRGPTRGRGVLFTILIAPMVLPHVVLGLGLFQVAFWSHMEDTLTAYVLAHTTIALPYAIITIGASLQGFDRRLEEAARSLGAAPWRAVLHVTIPAIRPGLVAAAIFSFVTSFDEFIITYFLSTRRATLPIQIFNSLSFQLDPSIAAVSGLTLMLTAGLTLYLMAGGQIASGNRVIR
jgi:putative spermidine/putrescine transport system permease protein